MRTPRLTRGPSSYGTLREGCPSSRMLFSDRHLYSLDQPNVNRV